MVNYSVGVPDIKTYSYKQQAIQNNGLFAVSVITLRYWRYLEYISHDDDDRHCFKV